MDRTSGTESWPATRDGQSELQLFHRSCAGELAAREAWGALLSERLLRWFKLRLPANELKELGDLTQEAALRCWQSMPACHFETAAQMWGYVFKVAQNLLDSPRRRRKDQRRPKPFSTLSGIDAAGALAFDAPDPRSSESSVDQRDETRRVHEAIEKLPAEERTVIELQLHGKSYEEIAGALQTSVHTVKSRLERARAHLRRLLDHTPIFPASERGTGS